MKTTNWNCKMPDSLVAQANEIWQLTNGDESNTNEIVSKGCAIEKIVTNLMTLPTRHSINKISDSTHGDQKYQIQI